MPCSTRGNRSIVYGVLLLTSLGWSEKKILLLEQVDYFARAKLNSNEVKKFVVSLSNLKIRVEKKCVTNAVPSFE